MLRFSNGKLYDDFSLDTAINLDQLMQKTYKEPIKEIEDSLNQNEWILIKARRNMTYYLNDFLKKRLGYVAAESIKSPAPIMNNSKGTGILNFDLLFGAHLPALQDHTETQAVTGPSLPFVLNEKTICNYTSLLKQKIEGKTPLIAFCESSSNIPAEIYGLFDRIYDRDFDMIPRVRERLLDIIPIELAWTFGYTGFDLSVDQETNIEWLWEIYYYIASFNLYEYYKIIIRTLCYFLKRGTKTEVPENLAAKEKERLKNIFLNKVNSIRKISRKKDINKQQIKGYKKLINRIEQDIITPFKGIDDNTVNRNELPTGILFEGPPGNGKTLIAQWIATELNAYVEVVSGPSLSSGIVGETPRRIRELFKRARQNAPSVIVFDEFDSIAGSRTGTRNELTVATTSMSVDAVPQLLAEMDGLNNRDRVLIIATTNLKSSIDEAFLNRPKRISYIIQITPPDEESRKDILAYYLELYGIKFKADTVQQLTNKTAGFSCDQLREQIRRLKKYLNQIQFDFQSSIMAKHIDGYFAENPLPEILVPVEEGDIAGYEYLKNKIKQEIIQKYNAKNINEVLIPKGILLEGPSGNGKTLIARWIAHEINAHLQIVSGPSLKSGIYGRTEAKIREVFERARMYDKAIIVFDEFDSIANARGGRNDVDNSIVNQLLTEMDGLKSRGKILIIATTNFKENIDNAFIDRPGRITYSFTVGYPNYLDRKKIINHYIKRMSRAGMDQEKEVATLLSAITTNYNCDEIREVVRQIVIHFKDKLNNPDKQRIDLQNIRSWVKDYLISKWGIDVDRYEEILKINAAHEVGHFVVWKHFKLDFIEPEFISVNPRRFYGEITPGTLAGISKNECRNLCVMLLAGMAGEELLKPNNPSLNGEDDVETFHKVNELYYRIFGKSLERNTLENQAKKILTENSTACKKYIAYLIKNFYFEIKEGKQ